MGAVAPAAVKEISRKTTTTTFTARSLLRSRLLCAPPRYFFVIPENFYRDLFITHTNFVSLLSSLARFSTNGISIYTLYIELYGFCANPAVMVVFSFEDYKKKYGVVFSLPKYEPYLFP